MSKVYIQPCTEYDLNLIQCILEKMIDDAEKEKPLFYEGQKVWIKPNLLSAKKPEQYTTTHPTVIRAVVRILKKRGCLIIIGDSPAGKMTRASLEQVYALTKMREIAEQEEVFLNYNINTKKIRARHNPDLEIPIMESMLEADAVVNCCKLKSHSYTLFSGAVKNCYGVIPGLIKAQYHARYSSKKNFCGFLADLADTVNPIFNIMDGIEGMQGNGPSGGELFQGNMLLGSLSAQALDHAAMNRIHLPLMHCLTHTESIKKGFYDPHSLSIESFGADISHLDYPEFKKPDSVKGLLDQIPSPLKALRHALSPYPVVNTARCTACRECIHDCPKQTIELRDGKAYVIKKDCIRCYCCQEVCPVQAVEMKR